jgi:hypothetical protein
VLPLASKFGKVGPPIVPPTVGRDESNAFEVPCAKATVQIAKREISADATRIIEKPPRNRVRYFGT